MSTRYSEVTCRGVSTWPAGFLKGPGERRRIFVATIDARLIALDAATGELAKLRERRSSGSHRRSVIVQSRRLPGDLSARRDRRPRRRRLLDGRQRVELERGVVRAYDAQTGALRWSSNPIPTDPADPARRTWKGGSADRSGAANA